MSTSTSRICSTTETQPFTNPVCLCRAPRFNPNFSILMKKLRVFARLHCHKPVTFTMLSVLFRQVATHSVRHTPSGRAQCTRIDCVAFVLVIVGSYKQSITPTPIGEHGVRVNDFGACDVGISPFDGVVSSQFRAVPPFPLLSRVRAFQICTK